MDNGLPGNIEELRAQVEFYEYIETQCELLRTGPRIELTPIACKELKRVRDMLAAMREKIDKLKERHAALIQERKRITKRSIPD